MLIRAALAAATLALTAGMAQAHDYHRHGPYRGPAYSHCAPGKFCVSVNIGNSYRHPGWYGPRPGFHVPHGYHYVNNPRYHGLDPRYHYYQKGNHVYRSSDFGKTLILLGLVTALLH